MTDSTAAYPDCPDPREHRDGAANPGPLVTWIRSLWFGRARASRPAATPTPTSIPTSIQAHGARLTTLKAMQVGDRGRVHGFEEGGRAYRRKLLSMGLTPGVQFQVLRVAPLGDPVEVRVRGSNLSLRKDEAATLRVEPLS